MIRVTIEEAQASLPAYIEQVCRGETVVVCKDRVALAELCAVTASSTVSRPLPGFYAGQVKIHPSFYEPMTPDELQDWYGPDEPKKP